MNDKKVICIKTCISDEYHIARLGDILCVDELDKEEFQKYIILKKYGFSDLVLKEIFPFKKKEEPLYPICNLYSIDEYNKKVHLGKFDARNFMTQADYRDSRIDEIFE